MQTDESDQAIVIRLTASQPGKINFTALFSRDHATTRSTDDNRLILSGKLGVEYETQLRSVVHGGSASCVDGKMTAVDADDVTLLVVGATSYNSVTDISGHATARCEDYDEKDPNHRHTSHL